MTGLTGLIDALLATKASPRMDVLAIKAAAEIGAPGPVLQVSAVDNDTRLPSNAALDRLLPAGPSGVPRAAGGPASAEIELSAAARLISTVLADLHGDAGPVRGATPAWPSQQLPAASALAATLAQTVSGSGLFYEAHLVEFTTGARSFAQLMQEPQARWSTPVAADASAAAADRAGPVALNPALPVKEASPAMALPPAQAIALAAAAAVGESGADAVPPGANPAGDRAAAAAAQQGDSPSLPRAASPNADAGPLVDASRLQAAYARGEAAPPMRAHEAQPAQRSDDIGVGRHVVAASAVAASAAEVIHPQALTLVHQQLDLLATAVFRWSGQAWPGVPMNWSIEEETSDRQAEPGTEAEPRRWSTTLSMSLPKLGEVDLRLSLAGQAVQARLSVRETNTATQLRAGGQTLARRLEAGGLQLQDLQVAAMEQP